MAPMRAGAMMAVTSSPGFRLTLLGSFELTGPDGVVDLPSKKLAALLAYLACTAPRAQPRERLSTLLWGSHFDAQAKQNLRQALFRLRKVLGQGAIESDGETVSLNAAAVLCDVNRFQALVREGSSDALNAAADLYRGRLIDDVVVGEEGWNEWLDGERDRLLELALGALVRLGEQELADGHAEHALKAGQRAIALNNMREDAHRLIVQALAAAGRKAEALKHYENLVALLKRELNTEPDAATTSLVAQLGSTQAPGGPPTGKKVATPATSDRHHPNAQPAGDISADPGHRVKAERTEARSDAASPGVAARTTSPERRQLTIMVCTMVASTPLTGDLDPEEMSERIAPFHKVVTDVAAHYGGFIAQYLGDGVHVYFGYPAAHEHDAEQAVRAGLAMLDAVGRLKASSGATLRARAGIATGPVIVGEQLGTGKAQQGIAIGETPNLAARLQAVAAPGEVVIAASTRRLVGGMFDCRALGADELKGLPPSVEAWQVRGEMVGVSRFEARCADALSPLVGRQEEMELLLRRWDQAKLGEGRVVLLSGEPGIGKSRIAESLAARLEGEPHVRLRYFCSPHHTHSPLYPFITQLERAAGFEPGNSAKAKLDKLEASLKGTARNVPRDVALIAELLAVPLDGRYPVVEVSPQQKREVTLTALLDQLDGVAAQSPVLIVFEDVHWIDPTSLDLLDRMVARAANLPVLLVVTFRPELQPAWVGQPHVTMLPLSRLGRRDSASIIASITQHKALPNAIVEQILSHTDGVPLFIEELMSTLLESGLLRETPDSYVLDGPLPPLAIPTTLQASLVARLDRLASVKDVAQIGAAIGREFSHELIAAVSAMAPMDLDAALERLTGSGLISRRGTPPVATYSFKHALVQDAAYLTMLKSRRKQLHASIGKVLVERFPEMAEGLPEVIAHHFTEAGLASQAIDYWLKAGREATKRSANLEALDHIKKGIDECRKLVLSDRVAASRAEMELLCALPAPLIAVSGWSSPELETVYARAKELCLEVGSREAEFQIELGRYNLHLLKSEVRRADEIADSLLVMAKEGFAPDARQAYLLGALRTKALAKFYQAKFAAARTLLDQMMEIYDGERHTVHAYLYGAEPAAVALSYLAWMDAVAGQRTSSEARLVRALRQANAANHAFSICYVQCFAASCAQLWGEPQIVAAQADHAIRLANEHNFQYWLAWGRALLGWVQGLDAPQDGIQAIDAACAAYLATGSSLVAPYFEALACNIARLGDVPGSATREETLRRRAETTGVLFWQDVLGVSPKGHSSRII
jgi:class 3 adenylate cyclase